MRLLFSERGRGLAIRAIPAFLLLWAGLSKVFDRQEAILAVWFVVERVTGITTSGTTMPISSARSRDAPGYVEMLGRETFIGIETGGDTRFTVHAQPDVTVRQGDRVVFGLERGRLYLFDPKTEQAIARVQRILDLR